MTDTIQPPIFLIGYRGTGKSTVARELAARLGCDWVDSDDVIEQGAAKSISQIFADDGEPAFRKLEANAVAELCGRSRIVVALGGGAVLLEKNRQAIAATGGPVVWLTASVDTILCRVAADKATFARRPDLTKFGGRDEVESLLAQRETVYSQCATLVVDTEEKTAAQVADEIAASLTRPRISGSTFA